MNETISKQEAINVLSNYRHIIQYILGDENDLEKIVNSCIGLIENLSTTHPEQDFIRTIEDGIVATSSEDVYSCGMRNGMRWCKSLLDDKEPEYEALPSEQEEPRSVCGER